MNYQAALDYVLSFADYERLSRSAVVFDIARIEALLKRLDDPHKRAKSVHIAGTKGKGSTSAMISSVLVASGYRTGLYTSPHLLSMMERIQIDNTPITEDEFAAMVTGLKPEVEEVNSPGNLGELTTFEILTALAFMYFNTSQVDFQVLETGLGGRLDATNVVTPQVCAITSISLDHTEVLGDDLSKIAWEKAGIIKPEGIVICAPQTPEVLGVIEGVCRERRAKLIRVGAEVTWQRRDFNNLSQTFHLRGIRGEYDLSIPLLGEYQLENAAIAVAALEVLAGIGVRVSAASITSGLSRVSWPGRLQILQDNPLFIVDGAHNAYSAMKLRQALEKDFDFDAAILIVGTSGDKDIGGIVAELSPLTRRVIVAPSRHPRATPNSRLTSEFSKRGIEARAAHDVPSAIEMALAEAKGRDLICATGSLFVLAEVLEYMQNGQTG